MKLYDALAAIARVTRQAQSLTCPKARRDRLMLAQRGRTALIEVMCGRGEPRHDEVLLALAEAGL